MGSCISTKKSPTLPSPSQPPKLNDRHDLQDRTLVPESDPPCEDSAAVKISPCLPSPPPMEEETVKEVVSSESPTKPNYLKFHHQHQHQHQQKILRLPSFPKIEEKKHNSHFEEISEVSDNCSLTESVSISALTEYEEVTQRPRVIDWSPSKVQRKRSTSGEFYARNESPISRRNDNAGKSVAYSKEVGQQMLRQRNLSQNGMFVRDHGESSRRRSRSPATAAAVTTQTGMLCRSPSGNKIVRSVGRSPSRSPEIGRNVELRKPEMWPAKESLDDPLVSLECFIFL